MVLAGNGPNGLVVTPEIESAAVHYEGRHVRGNGRGDDREGVVHPAGQGQYTLVYIPDPGGVVLRELRLQKVERACAVFDNLVDGEDVGVEVERVGGVELLEDHLVACTLVEAAVDAGGAVGEGEETARGVGERHRVGDGRERASGVQGQAIGGGGPKHLRRGDAQIHACVDHPEKARRKLGCGQRPQPGGRQPGGKARAGACGGGVCDDVGPHVHRGRAGAGLCGCGKIRGNRIERGHTRAGSGAQIGPAHQQAVCASNCRNGADIEAERLVGIGHQRQRAHAVEPVEGAAGGYVRREQVFDRRSRGVPHDFQLPALQRNIAVGTAQSVVEIVHAVVEQEKTAGRDHVSAESGAS